MFGSDNLYGNPLQAVQDEGVDKETRILQIIMGSDLDAAVIDTDTDKDGAKCQAEILKNAFKCQDTKLKEFEKCKKAGLRAGTITSSATMQDECLGMGTSAQPDEKGKIFKTCVTKFEKKVQKRCIDKGVAVSAAAPGNCAASADIPGCIETLIECDVCSSLNAVDGLHRDCDLFDNGLADNSCGACRNSIDQGWLRLIGGPIDATCILGCAGTPSCLTSCNIFTTAECTLCLEAAVVCAATGPGSGCIGACLADPQGFGCQFCLQNAGCLECFGVVP